MNRSIWPTLIGAVAALALFERLGRSGAAATDAEADAIEVGASGDSLRYWIATEALRQNELRTKSQNDAFNSLNARATSALGFSVTGVTALAAAIVTDNHVVAAAVAAVPLMACAVICIYALWPRTWFDGAWSAEWLMSMPEPTELQIIEEMAKGGYVTLEQDNAKLQRIARSLYIAFGSLIMAPVLGLVAFVLLTPGSSRQLEPDQGHWSYHLVSSRCQP